MPGESACGDSWSVDLHPGRSKVMVVDGLGHGPDAAEAARLAIRAFNSHVRETPTRIIERMHDALRSSRGAAVAVAEIDAESGSIQYAGVGNISGAVVSGSETKSMISHSGTVGHQLHKVQEFTYPWPEGALPMPPSDRGYEPANDCWAVSCAAVS